MKITLEYNKVKHSVEVTDDTRKPDAELLFKRLLLSAGYTWDEVESTNIILATNNILGVKDEDI